MINDSSASEKPVSPVSDTAGERCEHAWAIREDKWECSFCGVNREIDFSSRPQTTTRSALEEIAAERRRQIDAEGYSHDHDDQHDDCELVRAASAYAMRSGGWLSYQQALDLWPWNFRTFKSADPRRDLIKAAALIVAEIERRDRQVNS